MEFSKKWQALFLILVFASSVHGQNGWVVQKEKDGIKISGRRSSTSPFNDIRVELDLAGNTEQLEEILLDVNKYKDWSYATKISRLIKQLGPEKLIYYTEIEVPWPATNRFFYANFELEKNPESKSIRVTAVNLPGYEPRAKDLLEVPFTRGVWNITTISKKSIHVDYTLEMNPGGSSPVWVLNLFSTRGPMESFTNIKKKMASLNP
jgi:hypothetical protein